jgi:hypothetical protein
VKASKGGDLESTKRIEDVLKVIREKVPAEALRSRTDDLVMTNDFTIVGQIDLVKLKARTVHFGEQELHVSNLRSINSTVTSGEAKLTIDAASYATINTNWLDSGYQVNADTPVVIAAAGEVDLYGNQAPGQYMSGPEGNRDAGGRGGKFAPGMLLGKIGEDGEEFIIGKKLEKTYGIEGKLFLRIYPFRNGGGNSNGSYTVKITTGEK